MRWVGILVPYKNWVSIIYIGRYICHWFKFQSNYDKKLEFRNSYPFLSDWVSHTPIDYHYFYQGAWIARKIKYRPPQIHMDIGSSVMTISVLSSFVPTIFVDYRPLIANLSNLLSISGSITKLPFKDKKVDSLSCLHVLEHIGLGRYGDPIDPEGYKKAAYELSRILKPGGHLYISAPIGIPRICFNAHRIFSVEEIICVFNSLRVVEFSLVDDNGKYIENSSYNHGNKERYACGLFEFERI